MDIVGRSSSNENTAKSTAFQSFLSYFKQRLKHPTKKRPQRRIPIPSEPVIGNITGDLFLVHCLNKFSELSLSAPTKFVSLSLVTSSGLPLVATIRLNAFRKSVVLNEHAISRCTALVAEHVNRHKYLLSETLRVILVVKGPA